jgi:TonB family protein
MVLLLVPLVTPQTLNLNYRSVMLAPPPEPPKISEPLILKLVRPTPPPKPTLPRKEAIVEPPPPLPMPKPVVRPPEVRIAEVVPPPAMAPSIAPSIVDPKPVPTAPPPQLSVLTNVFSNATSSAVTAAPTRNTEVAGFGDTTGSRAVGRTGKVEATGAGFGDVNKGSSDRGRSAAARVGSVGGFDAQAPAAVRKDNDRGVPVAAGFAAPSEAPKSSASGPPKVLEPKNEKPVEIVLKPRPDYTDEARKMRVEGEVLLRVLFASSGEVRVLEVVRGLGHGLNENAIRAAEQIRFKPAQRAGNPVDSTAIVHILFQLAY